MRWIIGSGKDIAVDNNQLQKRSQYIERVTCAKSSAWNYININGQTSSKFICCFTDDKIDGTFITAHVDDIFALCSLRNVHNGKFVIINSCMWSKLFDKKLLYHMMSYNRSVNLFFSKQELSVDGRRIFRQSTTINIIGQFGFQTSLSERELYRNREKGFIEAVRLSFNKVSPVILTSD